METRTEIIVLAIPIAIDFIRIDKNEKYKTVTYWITEDSGIKTREIGTHKIITSFKWSKENEN